MRRCTALVLAALVLPACGVRHGDADRDRALADTCLSTIIRAGLPAPTAAQISPERFAAERRRLVASGKRFNTVSPYKNVCTEIKQELQKTRLREQAAEALGALVGAGVDLGAVDLGAVDLGAVASDDDSSS